MLFTNHRWKLMCKSGWVLKLTSKRPHLQFLHFHLFTDSAHLWVPMLKYLCSYIVVMPSYNIDENHCHLVTAILALRNGVQIAHWSIISWCSKFESDSGVQPFEHYIGYFWWYSMLIYEVFSILVNCAAFLMKANIDDPIFHGKFRSFPVQWC